MKALSSLEAMGFKTLGWPHPAGALLQCSLELLPTYPSCSSSNLFILICFESSVLAH